ncbi:MAG: O-antigen ligase family protein [Bacteroidales bacterium]|nr:O-antigen ligase family protein [Bacteroidales bacterium]
MNRILDKIDFTVYAVIAFLIPLYTRAIPILMIVLFLTIFLRKSTYKGLLGILKCLNFYILALPFLLMVIGYFYSTNKTEAFFFIEIGSSLIIFPFLFYFFKNNNFSSKFHYVFKSYVIGVLISYIILWINIFPKYISTHDYSLLFYTSFSQIIKTPNHLSYNVLFAIIIVFLNLMGANRILLKNKSKLSIALSFFAFLLLSIYLFQLVAKSTIIIYVISLASIVIYSYIKKLIKTPALISIFAVIIGLSVFMLTIPRVQTRFVNMFNIFTHKQDINFNQKESSTLRFSAMIASVDLIKENWLIGVGTGDVIDELDRCYLEKNYAAAGRGHTNPHNQFLRSFLMSGIFGLLSVLLLFYLLFKTSFKKKSIMAIYWSFIMLMIFAIDDIFIFRDGVIYFAFFTSYFVFCHPKYESFLSHTPVSRNSSLPNDN